MDILETTIKATDPDVLDLNEIGGGSYGSVFRVYGFLFALT